MNMILEKIRALPHVEDVGDNTEDGSWWVFYKDGWRSGTLGICHNDDSPSLGRLLVMASTPSRCSCVDCRHNPYNRPGN